MSSYKREAYRRARKRLDEELPSRDRRLVQKFDDDLTAEGISIARRWDYLRHLMIIRRRTGKPLEDLTKDDIKRFLTDLNRRGLSEWTVHGYKVTFKKFYSWLLSDGNGYPELVSWIKTTPKNNNRIPRDSLLSDDDIKRLVDACDNPRDRAIILVLAESGVRASELLSLKVGNARFDKYGAILDVEGKTGGRSVRIISSAPALAGWLENHPERGNPQAPLWVNTGVKNHGEAMTYKGLWGVIRRIKGESGISKRVHPHGFRHSAATRLASDMTEAELCEYMGWVQGSRMASTYVHMAARDTDKAMLRIHGLVEEAEDGKEKMRVRVCPRCRAKNSPTSDFCSKCSLPLSREAVEEEREAREKLERILERGSPEVEALESLIERMIKEKLEG